jgi:ATP-dependent RNA helicase RhlE
MSHSFSDLKLNKQLLTAIADAGFSTPTLIQSQAIPHILGGHDVIGVAQTGTGKTAAFLLPLLMLLKYAKGDCPRALILVPTRELAIQIGAHFDLLAKNTDLRKVILLGGTGTKAQKQALAEGCDLLITTPGRFMELYLDGFIITKLIKHLVLDEAERLMDAGFKRQLEAVKQVLPRKIQHLFFSATMNERMKAVTAHFLTFPTEIIIEPEHRTAKGISQVKYLTKNIKTKMNLLQQIIEQDRPERVIIFCKTKAIATSISKYLMRMYGDESCRLIHGNKDQNTRSNAFADFSQGNINFLVTTDVVARGIDIKMVSHVINFDVPLIYEDYVHRIGRTGRATATGDSITFVSPADEYHIRKIEKMIGDKIPLRDIDSHLIESTTPFDELQQQRMDIDAQRKREDPNYGGAFHEKKFYKNKK